MAAGTNISTRKIEIYVNESDKDLKDQYYKFLRDWCYHSRGLANKMLSSLQSGDIIDNHIKNNLGVEDSKERSEKFTEMVGCAKSSMGYSFIKDEYKNKLPSAIKAAINNVCRKAYMSQKGDILKGERTNTSYKKGFPVYFTKNFIADLNNEFDTTTFNFTCIQNKEKIIIPMVMRFGRDKSNNQIIVDRIISGEYDLLDSSYIIDGKKMFLLLVFKQPNTIQKLDENKVLGVDLGINTPCYISVANDPKLRLPIGNKELFFNKRVGMQKAKRNAQQASSLNSGGRGRKHKLKFVDNIKDKEANFAKTMNHTFSKAVIDFAIKHKCGIINIEDLSNFSKNHKSSIVLRNWSYYQLQEMIKTKAEKSGIKVNIINPQYSSQRCNKCGNIDADNRVSENFTCLSCGYEDNADFNASQNISIAHTPEYIKEIKKHVKLLAKEEII